MHLLEVKQLNKECSREFLLEDVSFTIEEKGIYGFLGKSGSGKTVLADMLAGACECDGGSIAYKGRELYINEKQTAEVKRKIGYVPAKCVFDSDLLVFEVLDLVGKAKKIDPDKRFRQIKEALELTGLTIKSDVLVGELTPSEKKRLMIAGALLGNPDVLIMDEPLRMLEKKQADEVKKLITMLGTKKLLMIFSSRPSEIEEACTNIAILHGGKIVLWMDRAELAKIMSENDLGNLANVLDALTEKNETEEK